MQPGATAWARAQALRRSTPAVLALLVAGNLVPLAGVLFLGWDVATILILYWVENGVVGVLNIVRIVLAQGPDAKASVRPVWLPGRLYDAAFFTAHYGMFWVGHGVFVVTITGFARLERQAGLLAPLAAAVADPVVLVGSIGLLVSHASALYYDYIRKAEYRTASPTSQMWRPYPRLITLHLTTIMGAALLFAEGRPPVVLVALLVFFKTATELAVYVVGRIRAVRAEPQANLAD